EELVIFDAVGELAADAAIGADAVHFAVGLAGEDVILVHHGRRHQRPGRTGLHAFAAGDAGRSAHRVVEIEHDLGVVTTPGHADDVVDLHLAAGADAEVAVNAGIEVDRHGGMAAVGRRAPVAREPSALDVLPLDDPPERGIGIVRKLLAGLIGEQELGHHAASGLGAVGLRLHLHAGRRHADAACRQHALAFDFDHADAAVAVRPIAGFGRVAQMRQLDAEAARAAEDRLVRADVNLAFVDEKSIGFSVGAHGFTQVLCRLSYKRHVPHARRRNSPGEGLVALQQGAQARPAFMRTALPHDQFPSRVSRSSGKYFSTHRSGLGAAWPRPQIDASRIASDSSLSSAWFQGPLAISFTAFSVPTRQGVHWPQLSSSKNRIRLSATAFMSSRSDRITTACDPTKQPYFSSVPKSSGRSAIDAGRMPPDAPPGR